MTIQEYLALPEPEQAMEAAKCFTEKPWKHKVEQVGVGDYTCSRCTRCNERTKHRRSREGVAVSREYYELREKDCPIPDPITIDENTINPLFREYMEPLGMADRNEIIDDTWKITEPDNQLRYDFDGWVLYKATLPEKLGMGMAAKGYFK